MEDLAFLLIQLSFLVNFVICEVDLHLFVNHCDHTLDDIIRWHSEVFRRLVICGYQTLDSFCQQRRRSGGVLHEVKYQDVVEVTANLLFVVEVHAVMQFSKFQDDFNGFRLVIS